MLEGETEENKHRSQSERFLACDGKQHKLFIAAGFEKKSTINSLSVMREEGKETGSEGGTFSRSRGSKVPSLADDRMQRCRERNRIHARKTRLRKKEHMQGLQQRADELKQQQLRLKQIIDEKSTASILVGFATSTTDESDDGSKEDPRVEELLRRPVEEIPDSSKIPELPALILPGQHASKKAKAESAAQSRKVQDEVPSEGFDIALLAKDRSKCTPEELDQIRRERNRMHAKRTRDRKRLFMEEMGEICRQLEEENDLLRTHLKSIDPDFQDNGSSTTDVLGVTFIAPSVPVVPNSVCSDNDKRSDSPLSSSTASPEKRKQPSGNHLQHLLEAACCYELSRPDDATSSALFAVVEAINEASSSKRLRQETTYAQPTAAVGC